MASKRTCRLTLQIHPATAAGRRADRGLDEHHAANTVGDGREGHGRIDRAGATAARRAYRLRDLAVERRKAFEVTLGMARGHTRDASRVGAGRVGAARNRLDRFAEGRQPQLVRMLLLPFEAALAAIDADAKRVLVAG